MRRMIAALFLSLTLLLVATPVMAAPPERGTVPSVVGMSPEAAYDVLAAAGFTNYSIDWNGREPGAGGVITDQRPDAGSKVSYDRTVTVTVS